MTKQTLFLSTHECPCPFQPLHFKHLFHAWTCLKGLGGGAQELKLDCTPTESFHFDHWTLKWAWGIMTFFFFSFVSRNLAPGYTETHYNSTGKEVTTSPQIMVKGSILDSLLIGVWPPHPNAVSSTNKQWKDSTTDSISALFSSNFLIGPPSFEEFNKTVISWQPWKRFPALTGSLESRQKEILIFIRRVKNYIPLVFFFEWMPITSLDHLVSQSQDYFLNGRIIKFHVFFK